MKRLGLVAILTVLSGCAGRQSVLGPAGSDQASALQGLLTLMVSICGAIYLLVVLFLGAAIWRSRKRLAPADVAADDRGLGRGLAAWAVLITVGLSVLAGASFLVDRALARADASADPQVRVTAQQWWWRVEYREPGTGRWIETANELHLPLNRPTRIELRSSDVIHSFWIPNLSGKIDMIPGRDNHLTITPRRAGWVRGQCAEFCGLQHAAMALDAKVETPEEFSAWLTAQARPATAAAGPDTARGEALVTGGVCATCHSVRGTPAVARAGPDLTHVASRRSIAAGTLPMSRGSLMGWILQPQALKPGAQMPPTGLSAADAQAVVAYLEGLR